MFFMDLDKAIRGRKSVRDFSKKKPDWRKILECVDSMKYSPMAGGIFSLRLILVDNPQKLKSIADSTQQEFVQDAQYILIVCSNPSLTVNEYGEIGKDHCRQQAGAAIQNFLLKAEEKGLGVCWIGYFVEEQIRRDFKIPDEDILEAVLPIGIEQKDKSKWPKKGRKKKTETKIENHIFFNQYGNKRMKK